MNKKVLLAIFASSLSACLAETSPLVQERGERRPAPDALSPDAAPEPDAASPADNGGAGGEPDATSPEPDADSSDTAPESDAEPALDVTALPDAASPEPDAAVPPSNPPPAPGLHLLTIQVNAPFDDVAAMDFSYGYCSNVRRAQDCHTWHQSVARVLWENQLLYGAFDDQGIVVQETGWVRLNSSYFLDGDQDVRGDDIIGRPNRWLCEGDNPPTLNGSVLVWLDNQRVEANVYVVAMDTGGCSAALNIAELVDFLD